MSGFESRFYHQAAATAKPYLNSPARHRRCRPLRPHKRCHFHRYELRQLRFAQPLPPSEKLPALQATLTAKDRHALTAQTLLGNQTTPLRPRFRLTSSHPSSMKPRPAPNKMGSTYRSQYAVSTRSFCNYLHADSSHRQSCNIRPGSVPRGLPAGTVRGHAVLPGAHLNSLREACLGLAGWESPLKHLGIGTAPKKSTSAYASANRPWELYEWIFMQLLGKCQGQVTALRAHPSHPVTESVLHYFVLPSFPRMHPDRPGATHPGTVRTPSRRA